MGTWDMGKVSRPGFSGEDIYLPTRLAKCAFDELWLRRLFII